MGSLVVLRRESANQRIRPPAGGYAPIPSPKFPKTENPHSCGFLLFCCEGSPLTSGSVRQLADMSPFVLLKQKTHINVGSLVVLRREGSNLRPSGYEPDELPLLYFAI